MEPIAARSSPPASAPARSPRDSQHQDAECCCAGRGQPRHRHPSCYSKTMCRNIRPLFNFDPPATDDEIRAAAVQFVRKISGFTKPSHSNEQAFEQAVDEIAESARRLVAALKTSAPPRDREEVAARARARAAERFAR